LTLPSATPAIGAFVSAVRLRKSVDPAVAKALGAALASWSTVPWGAHHADLSLPLDPLAAYLLELSWRRWWFVSTTSFLADAYRLTIEPDYSMLALSAGVAGTLAAFGGDYGPVEVDATVGPAEQMLRLEGPFGPIVEAILKSPAISEVFPMKAKYWEHVRRALTTGIDEREWDRQVIHEQSSVTGEPVVRFTMATQLNPRDFPTVFHLISPDPLEQLVHQMAGLSRPQ
jgi:hypothetical protein